eukprot:scaffold137283_cov27-Tisochrysis_lutea.AAC.3
MASYGVILRSALRSVLYSNDSSGGPLRGVARAGVPSVWRAASTSASRSRISILAGGGGGGGGGGVSGGGEWSKAAGERASKRSS